MMLLLTVPLRSLLLLIPLSKAFVELLKSLADFLDKVEDAR